MKVLITGITGMVGSHLAEYFLNESEHEVHGTLRWRSQKDSIAGFEDNLNLHQCELRDSFAVSRLLREVKPDCIFHYAAQSSVHQSWDSAQDTLINNTVPLINIFESLKLLDFLNTKIHIAGSSEEYGLVLEDELPVSEKNMLKPMSPYGVSKVTQSALGFQYFKNYGLKVFLTRAFNHTGPGRNEAFVTSSFAKQIVEIEAGRREPVIMTGNLSAKRDFSDIRDIVRAYALAVNLCEPGEIYNIGSDVSYSIKEVLDMLLELSGIDISIETDSHRMRPLDVPELRCDSSKFREKTGWKPVIPIKETLNNLLDYWRSKLNKM